MEEGKWGRGGKQEGEKRSEREAAIAISNGERETVVIDSISRDRCEEF